MRPRIYKELRLLLVPAAAMLVATVVSAWMLSTRPMFGGQGAIAQQIAAMAFILGVPLIAATPIGAEFHHRTLGLLLAQPIARWRLWLEKWLTSLAVLIGLAALQYGVGSRIPGWPTSKMLTPANAGVLICSVPLWSLIARSTIGGLTLGGGAVVFIELGMGYVHYRLTGTLLHDGVFAAAPAFDVVRASYAAVTLIAGWWLFTRYQANTARVGEYPSDQKAGLGVLRARSSGAIANLVRKELMLQRLTFMVTSAFAICWLLAMLNVRLQGPTAFSKVLFPFLLGVFVPVVTVLAGTLSMSEDRSLGTHGWHLTLPIESKLQWEVKLGVSLAVGLLLGVGVPALLARLAAPPIPAGQEFRALAAWRPIEILSFALVLCFWGSSLFGHTIRAVVAVGASVLACLVGIRLIVSPVADFLASHASVRLPDLSIPNASSSAVFEGLVVVFLTAIAVPALVQSLSAFRRIQSMTPALVRAVLGLLVTAWIAFLFVGWLAAAGVA